MLSKPPLEKLLPKAENRYVLAMLAAKRARQLVDGANPLIDTQTPNNVTISCEELVEDKIAYRKGQHEPVIALRPEIEAKRLAEERENQEKRANELAEDVRRLQQQRERKATLASNSLSDFGGDSFTSEDAAVLAQKFIQAVEASDEQERQLEMVERPEETDNAEDIIRPVEENSAETVEEQ